ALFDIAYLYADLVTKVASERYKLGDLQRLLRKASQGSIWRVLPYWSEGAKVMRFFEYSELPNTIQKLGSEQLFLCLFAGILLGRLKFDLTPDQKRATILIAVNTLERANLLT